MSEKPPAKKVHVSESGRAAAVRTGTSEREVAEALTGVDELPEKGMELGRPPARPDFDPRAEVEVEDAFTGETVISTMVFVGVDEGGDFEKRLREIIAYAEGKDLFNLTVTIGALDGDIYDAIVNPDG